MKIDLSYIPGAEMEATVSSKGQVTLPKALRDLLGIHTGSRIRFHLSPQGGVHCEPVHFSLEDLWEMADAGPRATDVMTFEAMDAAKARRVW
jgi:AbrB family looped-hinge helix DNA binding protein